MQSLSNRHGFFSDYWLGTALGGRGSAGNRLSPAQTRIALSRITRAVEVAKERFAPLDLTTFREKVARPLLQDYFGFTLQENAAEPRVRALSVTGHEGAGLVALALLCPDPAETESRQVRKSLEDVLVAEKCDYGLLVSPEVIRLLRRPGLGARGASFDLRLGTVSDLQDADSVVAAHRVLAAPNFLPNETGVRPIDLLESDSRRHSAKVSNDLKTAVFQAAEQIVSGFLDCVQNSPEQFSPRPTLSELRDAGFMALYRLLFILYAEARDERLIAHGLYQRSYSLDHIVSKLLRAPTTGLPSNRFGLWLHIAAVFRVFNEGMSVNIPDLENIPPRGGRLFSDETPEGRLLLKLRLADRQTAEILLGLATTNPRRGVGRERVSFRELEIEQLGSVYEGLLEYEPAEASETLIDVRLANQEIAVTPEQLAQICEQKDLRVIGEPAIVVGTVAARLHAEFQDEADDEEAEEQGIDDEDDAETAEGDEDGDELPLKRGAPIRLLRRIDSGTFFFRPGPARKASGSYYTPTAMVDFLVREALAPIVENKSAAEIEGLRVIDIACGSAHFLVGAARFLGPKLFEAYQRQGEGRPPPEFYPDRALSPAVRARWGTDGHAWCKRRIVERCLFGVDLNPAAVQLAQVALWIESLAGDRPLSFFAHHIRCGNALLGSSLARFDAPPDAELSTLPDQQTRGLFEADLRSRLHEAVKERRLIDAPLPASIRADTPEEYAYKEDRLRRAERALIQARLLLDLRSASPFMPEIWRDLPILSTSGDLESLASRRPWWQAFQEVREREKFFHWELEFPEVFLESDRPGFDAVLGNPPWDKVLPSKHEFYSRADVLIRAYKGNDLARRIKELHRASSSLEAQFESYRRRATTFARVLRAGGDFPLAEARSQAAHEDVSKYFVDRAIALTRNGGTIGLVVPGVFYNGDGWVGIRRYLLEQATIQKFYAFENRRKIFPIDSRYKFVNLVARKAQSSQGLFRASFMRQETEELNRSGEKPWEVVILAEEVKRLSPETLSILEFRSPRDQEIVEKMYRNGIPLGSKAAGTWGAYLFTDFAHLQIYNGSRDKDLFTDPTTGRLHSPDALLKNREGSANESVDRMRAQGFWPVYEGKTINQFLTGIKPFRWWLAVEKAEKKYGKAPRAESLLVFRETASNTNERTCIAAILPPQSVASHKLTGIIPQHVSPEAALTVLNSFCFDYALRLRTAGTNVSFTYILPVAVPRADIVKTLPTFSSRDVIPSGAASVYGDRGNWERLWEANWAVARAYGLDAHDLAHILSRFPVFAAKHADFVEFMSARIEKCK